MGFAFSDRRATGNLTGWSAAAKAIHLSPPRKAFVQHSLAEIRAPIGPGEFLHQNSLREGFRPDVKVAPAHGEIYAVAPRRAHLYPSASASTPGTRPSSATSHPSSRSAPTRRGFRRCRGSCRPACRRHATGRKTPSGESTPTPRKRARCGTSRAFGRTTFRCRRSRGTIGPRRPAVAPLAGSREREARSRPRSRNPQDLTENWSFPGDGCRSCPNCPAVFQTGFSPRSSLPARNATCLSPRPWSAPSTSP